MQVFHIRYRNTQGTLMRILELCHGAVCDIPLCRQNRSSTRTRLLFCLT